MKGGGPGFIQNLRDNIIGKRKIETEEDKNNRPRFVKMLDDAIAEARGIKKEEKKLVCSNMIVEVK